MDSVVYYTGQAAIKSVPRKAAEEAAEASKTEPREASKIDPRKLPNRRKAADKAVEGSNGDPISTDVDVSSIFAAIFFSIFAGPGQSHAGRPNRGPEKAVEKIKRLTKKSSKPPAGQMCRAHVPLAVVVDLRRSNG